MDGVCRTYHTALAVVLTMVVTSTASAQQPGCTDDGCADAGTWLTTPSEGRIIQTMPEPATAPSPLNQAPIDSQPLVQPQPEPSFFDGGGPGGELADLSTIPGYIESAVPRNMFRLRYDGMFENQFPDRAEFVYGQIAGGIGNQSVDLHEVRGYLELSDNDALSVFVDVPVRWVDADVGIGGLTGNPSGFGDLQAGLKYAFAQNEDTILTFLLQGYFPSGEAAEGLGTDHYSVETGLLFQHAIDCRTNLFGELRIWNPIDGTNFAGDIVRYGLGYSRTLMDDGAFSVTSVSEMVGWSVLDGLQTARATQGPESAETTIVNAKFGVRLNWADCNCGPDTRSLYVGYGRALTNDAWYENIFRIDYSIFF